MSSTLRSGDEQSNEWLVELAGWWRDLLDLDGWRIKVAWARQWGMQSGPNQGECAYRYATKDATIRILGNIDRDGNPYVSDDAETDLVHELLHLHFSGFFCTDEDNPINAMQEQVITVMARSYVALKRMICVRCFADQRDVCEAANDNGDCPLVQVIIEQAKSGVVTDECDEVIFDLPGTD